MSPTKTRARTTKTAGSTHPLAVPTPQSTTDLYDALTLEIERADVLTEHLADRLSELANDEPQELYALSLVADGIRERYALILDKTRALFKSGDTR